MTQDQGRASIEPDDPTAPFDIVHVTSAHPVGDTRIFVKEARTLARAGYRVAVLGPGRTAARQCCDAGVIQITVPAPGNRMVRFGRFGAVLAQAALALRPRAVHLHDPDLLRQRARFQGAGVRVIFDMHEDFPKVMLSRTWLGPMPVRRAVARIIDRLERRALAQVDGIVLADTQLERRLSAGTPPAAVVRNYLDLSEWAQAAWSPAADAVRCIYVGDITAVRGLMQMCDAIAACRAAGLQATLDLIGPCPPSLQAQVRAHPAAAHIRVHGRQDRAAVAAFLAQSDIGFGFFAPTPAYREGLPVKLFEYLASGLPVVGTALPRLQAETALAEGLFLVDWPVAPADAVSAIRAAHALDAQTRRALRDKVRADYNWDSEADALIRLYTAVFDPTKGR